MDPTSNTHNAAASEHKYCGHGKQLISTMSSYTCVPQFEANDLSADSSGRVEAAKWAE